MSATVSQLRTGLSTAMSTLLGVRTYDTIPDAPVAPAAIIELRAIGYDSTFARGSDDYTFNVLFISGRADDRTAQSRLEGWLAGHGTGSVKQAVETDETLGGICSAVRVIQATGFQSVDVQGVPHLAVEFTITLLA